jgi:hypothetical protein
MEMLVPAIIGFFGVLVGVAIEEFRLWREREDRLKVMLFERLLEAHQQALGWVYKLQLAISGGRDKTVEAVEMAREWWFENNLYLDKVSRDAFPKVYGLARYACEHPEDPRFLQQAEAARRAIIAGIGEKYLPSYDELGINGGE